ncbi:MAG: ABC transporter permease [Chloroflexi bacterium]|nr:ABC transporter permease [Chloroflexota bacterium]MBU1750563.1 ABC transporter permease [Chloroflexota bacterium]
MSMIRVVWRNIAGSSFRSSVVFLCALLMAGFAVSATLVGGGAETSLRLALERLGADVLVVPAGSMDRVEHALLMGQPAITWMPRANVDRVATIPGVAQVSPQLFLATLRGATCCSVPEMFVIAYEPETDFTLRPWLESHLEGGLALGEAVGGSFLYVPADQDNILIYGYGVTLKGNLEQTGTGLDQSMFFTFETAYEIARLSPVQAEQVLDIPPDSVSAILVRVQPDRDPQQVAQQIESDVPDVSAMASNRLFRNQRDQMLGLFRSIAAMLGVTWVLAVALVGLVFSIAIHERRRQIGVLRALGAARGTVLQSLLAEGVLLALTGGLAGSALAALAVFLFRNLIVQVMGAPFLFPAPLSLLALILGALALTLVSVTLAILIPAVRISRQEPAASMRE